MLPALRTLPTSTETPTTETLTVQCHKTVEFI